MTQHRNNNSENVSEFLYHIVHCMLIFKCNHSFILLFIKMPNGRMWQVNVWDYCKWSKFVLRPACSWKVCKIWSQYKQTLVYTLYNFHVLFNNKLPYSIDNRLLSSLKYVNKFGWKTIKIYYIFINNKLNSFNLISYWICDSFVR